jgi:hypothetical protein
MKLTYENIKGKLIAWLNTLNVDVDEENDE